MLLTYEQASAIVAQNESFKKKHQTINGQEVVQFTYFLAGFIDFLDPLNDGGSLKAFEMRGLTFIKDDSGAWQRHLFLNKFFNVNQVPGWMEEDVRNKKIIKVQNKEDGSAIRFMRLGGKLVAKTKFSFEAEQAAMAMEVVNSDANLKEFIEKTLDSGLAALFEITSPFNRVVLNYQRTDLILLQMRDEMTGEYLDIDTHPLVLQYGIKRTESQDVKTLQDYLELKKVEQGIEGRVLTFEDGQKAKVKTDWYMSLHHVLSNSLKEHVIIENVLNETIDDVLSMIPIEHTDERRFIDDISTIIIHHVNHKANEIYEFVSKNFDGDKKEFAMKYKSDPRFYLMTRLINDLRIEVAEKAVIVDVLKATRRLEMARKYLSDLGFVRTLKEMEDDN